MKVSSISSLNYNYNNAKVSFKHTAVAYPEYEYANKDNTKNSNIFTKLAELFQPEVTKNAKEIKTGIDYLYANSTSKPENKDAKEKSGKSFGKKQLLSVFA